MSGCRETGYYKGTLSRLGILQRHKADKAQKRISNLRSQIAVRIHVAAADCAFLLPFFLRLGDWRLCVRTFMGRFGVARRALTEQDEIGGRLPPATILSAFRLVLIGPGIESLGTLTGQRDHRYRPASSNQPSAYQALSHQRRRMGHLNRSPRRLCERIRRGQLSLCPKS